MHFTLIFLRALVVIKTVIIFIVQINNILNFCIYEKAYSSF